MWDNIVGMLAGLLIMAAPVIWFMVRQVRSQPKNRPAAYMKRGGRPEGRQLVVCAGDSLTQGTVSASYLTVLEKTFTGQGVDFVNAGVNAELAYNLRQRLDEIIACQPDVITVLIGTNDVNATLNKPLATLYKVQEQLPVEPTIEWYRENLEAIVTRLKAETSARIALLSLPPLGEDLTAEANQRVRAYCEVIREIAAAEQVAYLPLHETFSELLPEDNHDRRYIYDGLKSYIGRATFQYYVLGKSWDAISEARGFLLLTDHVHMNERAAGLVGELIAGFVRESLPELER